jgi:hypothetical protein
VHGWTTSKHRLTRFTTTWTWGKPPPFPLYYFLCLAIGPAPNVILSRDFQVGHLWFWRRITLCVDFRLRWCPKQSRSRRYELSNSMWDATCMQGNRGDSRLLVVGNQIVNLTIDLFFGHNLCLKYPNGSCGPILDIYVPRAFPWYEELFNLMGFDSYNCSLKI